MVQHHPHRPRPDLRAEVGRRFACDGSIKLRSWSLLKTRRGSQGLIGEVYESARVLSEEYDEVGRVLKVRGLPGAITRLQRSLAAH